MSKLAFRCLTLLVIAMGLAPQVAADESDPLVRELFVPFEDLDVVLKGGGRRVFLTRSEYDDLISKAGVASDAPAPVPAMILSTRYDGLIQGTSAILRGRLSVEVTASGVHAVELPLAGVGLLNAELDGNPAAMGEPVAGKSQLFVEGRGRHELLLDLRIPVKVAAAQQTLQFQLPAAGSGKLDLRVPGNVDVKSGLDVLSRTLAGDETQFELLLNPNMTTLVLSLSSDQRDTSQILVARTVLVDELTETYERLHVTASMHVPHGAIERFRFAIPQGFDVTEVTTPLLSRWQVVELADREVLEVQLREPVTGTEVLNISAQRNAPELTNWQMPNLQPLDVAGSVSIVGLVVEEQLRARALKDVALIPIDVATLAATLPSSILEAEPGAPKITPIAAYFSPDNQFQLAASFTRPAAELEVATNQVLKISDTGLALSGGFTLFPLAERTFEFNLLLAEGWELSRMMWGDQDLEFESHSQSDGRTRARVKLAESVQPGADVTLQFEATQTPDDWLTNWDTREIEFPKFEIQEATGTRGAIAIQAIDDIVIYDMVTSGLSPLDEKEKARHGFASVVSDLAYYFETGPAAATFVAQRVTPRLTAETYSFLRIEPGRLLADFELVFDVAAARTSTLAFELPLDTPEEISVEGLDGASVKEFRGVRGETARRWDVALAAPTRGFIRLGVSFEQPLDPGQTTAASGGQPGEALALPIVKAAGVQYQTGSVAVEGSAELEVALATPARRIDVGELIDARYQPGRRLLGTYGFVGDPVIVSARVTRPEQYGLPSAIIQRGEIVSAFSNAGLCQSAARFQLKTKSQFVQIELPKGSVLWAAYLDGSPSQPQRNAERLLISIPRKLDMALRDLQLVYETPTRDVRMWGDLEVVAPKLFRQDEPGAPSVEVPMADLEWYVSLPAGYRLANSKGRVLPDLTNAATLKHLAEYKTPLEQLASRLANGGWRPTSTFASRFNETASVSSGEAQVLERRSGLAAKGAIETYEFAEANGPEPPAAPDPQTDRDGDDLFGDAPAAETAAVADPAPRFSTAGDLPDQVAQVQADTRKQPAPRDSSRLAGGKYWALEGLRSLQIDLATSDDKLLFRSLGHDPVLDITVVDDHQLELLAWGLALLVVAIGLGLVRRPFGTQARYVAFVLVLASVVPLLVGWQREYGRVIDLLFYAGLILVPLYSLFALGAKTTGQFRRRWFAQGTMAVLCVLVTCIADGMAQQATEAQVGPIRVKLLGPETPVTVPKDVVIVPYNPSEGTQAGVAEKVIVPYEKYVELWDLAYPDRRLELTVPPAEYAWAGAEWQTTLTNGDALVISGRVEMDTFVDGLVAVPISWSGGVLEQATMDGEPARIAGKPDDPGAIEKSNQQAESTNELAFQSMLLIDGKGRHQLEFAIRYQLTRRGGWRVVDGRLPSTSAAKLSVRLPEAETEFRLLAMGHRTEHESSSRNEVVDAAISNGEIQLQWRPRVEQAAVDRSLTAVSDAVFDVQEDSLRLVWSTDFLFPRATRDAFEINVSDDYLVERVTGENIRSWRRTNGQVSVLLLNPVRDAQRLTLHLTRRGAVGQGDLADIDVPVMEVPDAVLHEGRIALRRSPLLDLSATQVEGLVRTDLQSVAAVKLVSSASPLGIKPYQAYRFARTPYRLRLSVNRVPSSVQAETQALMKISENRISVEARVILTADKRPLHRVTIQLPPDFKREHVSTPGLAYSAITEGDDGIRRLSLHLSSGRLGKLEVILRGTLATPELGDAAVATLPQFFVEDVQQQQTTVVVQSSPGLSVRTSQLTGCEQVLLERSHGWLEPSQRSLARLAIHAESADFSGEISLRKLTPRIRYRTISNLRVTARAFEETILLDFHIEDAGMREVSFLLPSDLREARISAPLLRRKSIEDVSQEQIRVRLELKDALFGQFRVLVENDRLVTGDERAVPIPIVETGVAEEQFVALESAGHDEVIVASSNGVEPLARQQSQWRTLANVLGDQVTQAFLISSRAQSPRLVIQTRDRQTLETVGARIAFAETRLAVDEYGAFRGTQTFQVDNRTEQFLEVVLPQNALLWTARVAGEPVKPSVGNGVVRIPLVKTAEGDQDYQVELKYGGALERPARFARVSFPLLKTVNIKVEESQVRLHLPDSLKWFDFDGTMQNVREEADLIAGYVQYKKDQLMAATSGLTSQNPFARARSFSNLKKFVGELEALNSSSNQRGLNVNLEQQLESSRRALQIAKRQLADERTTLADVENEVGGNSAKLNYFYEQQSNDRSTKLFSHELSNFYAKEAGDRTPSEIQNAPQSGQLQHDWIYSNQLGSKELLKNVEGHQRINIAGATVANQPQRRYGAGGGGSVTVQNGGLAEEGGYGGGYGGFGLSPDAGQDQADAGPNSSSGYAGALQDKQTTDFKSTRGKAMDRVQRFQEKLGQQSRDGAEPAAPGNPSAGREAETRFRNDLPQLNQPSTSTPMVQSLDGTAPADSLDLANQATGGAAGLGIPGRTTGLASLAVSLPMRGTEYMFKTPRGDLQISARSVDQTLVNRMRRLAYVVATLVLIGLVYQLLNQLGFDRVFGKLTCLVLLLAGLALMLQPVSVLLPLSLIAFSVVQFVRVHFFTRPHRKVLADSV